MIKGGVLMKKWMIAYGDFAEDKKQLIFHGQVFDHKDQNTGNMVKVSQIGKALHSGKISNGTISATVEFKKIEDGFSQAFLVLLNYSSINNTEKYVRLGINRLPQTAFEYREFDGNEYNNQKIPKLFGSSINIKENEKYNIKIIIDGSNITLLINDFTITKENIKMGIEGNQVAILCQSTGDIIIHEFSVDTSKRKAFVIMQYSKNYDDLYREVIEPVCKAFDYEVIRADESVSTGMIIQDIISRIQESSVIIADITPDNANVFYEVGYSHALNKPTILLNDRHLREKLPFDVSGLRTIFYDNSISGKTEVENRLRLFMENINVNVF